MAYGNGGTLGTSNSPGYADMQAKQIERMPLVAMELERQAKAIEHLHSLISDLDGRLSAILRPTPPTVQAAPNAPAPQAHPVPMANGLFDQNVRLDAACARLQSLFDRIEL